MIHVSRSTGIILKIIFTLLGLGMIYFEEVLMAGRVPYGNPLLKHLISILGAILIIYILSERLDPK